MKQDNNRAYTILALFGILPVTWLALLIAPSLSGGLVEILKAFPAAMDNPFHIVICEDSLKTILIFLCAYGLGLGIFLSSRRKYRRGEEHGSAQWGNVYQLNKKYQDKDPANNRLLTRHFRMSLNGRHHLRNLLSVVVGGSGSGKSFKYCVENLAQANTSYVVLDPKGELLRNTGQMLEAKGYEVRVLDLLNMERSHCYALKQDKEKYQVPRRVQDVIPIQRMWSDGIFQVGSQFSRTWLFSDTNYQVASLEDKKVMFLDYSELLNSLDSGAAVKLTINNRLLNRANFEQSILMPLRGDSRDVYRQEYNEMLLSKATGANGIIQEKYITITVAKKNVEEARAYFARVGTDLIAHFAALGSKCVELDATERLRILHDFYRQGEEADFHFDARDMMKKGHDFRDYICPDSMEKFSDHLILGEKFCRVLFLKDYANYIKRGAYPTAITQNVEYLLDSVQASTMLFNSECVVMLNQAASDRAKLAKLLNISNEQMSYVTNADAGCGLIKYGSALVPFVNRFPKDTQLYKLMTTKPGEGVFGGHA